MTTDVYTQHDAAFSQVAAYAILDPASKPVAKVAFKFPRDGAGRLTAFVHWLGRPMVRGTAGGCGYDKSSAAIGAATRKRNPAADQGAVEQVFWEQLEDRDGRYWHQRLQDAGFRVFQTV